MRERILASLKAANAQIIEEITEGDIWAISYRQANSKCGHAILQGEKVISHSCYNAKKPEALAKTIAIEKGAGNIK